MPVLLAKIPKHFSVDAVYFPVEYVIRIAVAEILPKSEFMHVVQQLRSPG